MRQVLQKRIGARVGKREKAYSQTPEARLRQPEPRRERARALTPSQSNRFVKKPSSSPQEEALKKGMAEKSREFTGSELYTKA